ncbi:MAG TPA: hypothetical protein VN706_04980, partial [Gemmatimonadaceae bacterium]|nr:hypothetical protein [Gemmatimonadaceae bacterium]
PTVNTTGTWVGTLPGSTVPITFALGQSVTGLVNGTSTNVGGVGVIETVIGTVNGDTLRLFIGNPCGACSLSSIFTGIVNSTSTSTTGTLFPASSSFTAVKQ